MDDAIDMIIPRALVVIKEFTYPDVLKFLQNYLGDKYNEDKIKEEIEIFGYLLFLCACFAKFSRETWKIFMHRTGPKAVEGGYMTRSQIIKAESRVDYYNYEKFKPNPESGIYTLQSFVGFAYNNTPFKTQDELTQLTSRDPEPVAFELLRLADVIWRFVDRAHSVRPM